MEISFQMRDPSSNDVTKCHIFSSKLIKKVILLLGAVAEIKMYNEFMKNNKPPTDTNLKNLAKIYKESANGKDIFYKLPNMLKSYSKTWAKNSDIKTKEQAVVPGVNMLLEDLFCTRTSGDESKMPPTEVEAENILQEEFNNDEDDGIGEASTAEMFVCPINVPQQTPYVPLEVSIAPVPIAKRHCAPACTKTEQECGGFRIDFLCAYFKDNKKDNKEFVASNQEKKKAYDKERKKLTMRELRKRRRQINNN